MSRESTVKEHGYLVTTTLGGLDQIHATQNKKS